MAATAISAPFGGDSDVHAMRDFLIQAAADNPRAGYFHVGDLLWGLYQNTVFDPRRDIRLWRDGEGGLLGFAWFREPAFVDLQVHPTLRGQGWLEGEMLAWAEGRRQECARTTSTQPAPLQTAAFEPHPGTAAALLRLGFEPGKLELVHLEQTLSDAIPDAELPDGFVIRHVAEEAEFAERVAIHREVWHPSKVTLGAYRRLRTTDGYLPELDLVAVAADGTAASYCICWLDSVNRSGEFEPVGTRAAFRGRGLGKAVVREGLRRLRDHGARTAIVYAEPSNDAARALYASAGFRQVGAYRLYRRSG